MAKKKCKTCNKTKGVYLFYKNPATKDKRESECKECQKKRASIHYHSVYKKNKVKCRRQTLLGKYGITLEQYDIMLKEQGGVCAICGNPEILIHRYGNRASLCVDHCHKTGKIRGLLCRKCNTSIAALDEDIDVLASAISYLINATARKAV